MDKRATGADLIAAERQRQITDEGYDATHDEGASEELAQAAACYALGKAQTFEPGRVDWDLEAPASGPMPTAWPWGAEYYKPKDRLSNLVRAGALIAAAIDSLLGEQLAAIRTTEPQPRVEAVSDTVKALLATTEKKSEGKAGK